MNAIGHIELILFELLNVLPLDKKLAIIFPIEKFSNFVNRNL